MSRPVPSRCETFPAIGPAQLEARRKGLQFERIPRAAPGHPADLEPGQMANRAPDGRPIGTLYGRPGWLAGWRQLELTYAGRPHAARRADKRQRTLLAKYENWNED